MPTRQNTEVPLDWQPPPAPTRQATVADVTAIPDEPPQERLSPKRQATEVDHDAFPADPPRPRRETNADVGVNFDAPDEAEDAPEPAAKKRCTAIRIEIPYTAAEDPEEHRKQIQHILSCVARAAVETVEESVAAKEAETGAEAKPKNGNLTAVGNVFPDAKTGKVHVQDKTA